MRAGLCLIAVAVTLTGCAPLTPMHRSATPADKSASTISQAGQGSAPPAPPPPPEPLSPFDDSPVIIAVPGQHFSSGERVIVTVCLGADHSIVSADIFESSGDSKFDQLAVMWARRIRLRDAAPGNLIASCGPVRVEVRPAQEPRVFHPPGDSLS